MSFYYKNEEKRKCRPDKTNVEGFYVRGHLTIVLKRTNYLLNQEEKNVDLQFT